MSRSAQSVILHNQHLTTSTDSLSQILPDYSGSQTLTAPADDRLRSDFIRFGGAPWSLQRTDNAKQKQTQIPTHNAFKYI